MFTMSSLYEFEKQKVAVTFKWHYAFRDVIKTIYSTHKLNLDKHILNSRFFKINGKVFDISNVIGIEGIEE